MWYLLITSPRMEATYLLTGNQNVKNNFEESKSIW
jgi:hypothetical protein